MPSDTHQKVEQLEQARAELQLVDNMLARPPSGQDSLETSLERTDLERRQRTLRRHVRQLEDELEKRMGSPDKPVPEITWLHLSDLHLRPSKGQSTPGLPYEAGVVLSSLLEDVAERSTQDGLQPDFIVVTGDIAFSGARSEYALARLFFDDLLRVTGLAKDRLFLVPGNHDVDRAQISRGADAIAASVQDREALNAVLADAGDRNLMLRRFDGYMAFVRCYLGDLYPFDKEHYWYVRTFNAGWRRVALIGLNSAWLGHGGPDDLGQLALGELPTRKALEQARSADLRIALLHHPLEWLRGFDRNDSAAMLADRCDFILHGHLHRIGLLQARGPDTNAMIIAAGAGYEARRSLNSYNLVQLDLATGRGTVYLRAYVDERGGFWTWDGMHYRNVPNGTYQFEINRG